jgi:type 1 glutamine amidotransferase
VVCLVSLAGLAPRLSLAALAGGAPSQAKEEATWRPSARRPDALRVLLVTGGHDHDVDFYSAFLGQDDLAVMVDGHPSAFSGAFGRTGRRIDVLVLYDMPPDLPAEQRARVERYVEEGGAVVSLHHAISGSPPWTWLHEVVLGARWRFGPEDGRPASVFKHDEEMAVKVVARHPVTEGIDDFRIVDETYGKLWWSPRLEVLLRTDHPQADGPVAWIMPHPKARLCVIQLGHGREAHLHPVWQKLVRNAVRWAGGR